jgi:glycosyltransferase involved in cell wall biosynthesis
MSPCRVCMFGAYRDDYARHQIIRAGLERQGIEVSSAHIPIELGTFRKLPHLLARWWQIRACDVVLIPAFNELIAPFIWMMCRVLRKPVLLDYLIGLTDAIVDEHQAATPLKRALYWQVDRFNITAMPTLTDTQAHIELFEGIWGRKLTKTYVLPFGVYDTWYHEFPPPSAEPPLLVQFFGSYIPFQGVDVIIDAIAQFKGDSGIRFELIGRGKQYYELCVKKARALNLDNVTFAEKVPQPDLPARIARASICLGVFGARAKTDYVVPNKVFQSMAIGRPVITAEAKALHEFFRPGEHLITVPAGNSEALAKAIRNLVDSPEDRARIGRAAASRIREAFVPGPIGAQIKAVLEQVMSESQVRQTR